MERWSSGERLETARLWLEPVSLDDRLAVFQEFTEAIATFMYPKPSQEIRETDQFLSHALRQNASGTDLHLTIRRRETAEFLGLCGMTQIQTPTPELGIWLKEAAHGQGYGKEAIARLKAWADEHLDYECLRYPVDRRNLASRKLAEHLGGRIVGEYTQMNLSGRMLEVLEYRIYP
ncbi:GNAT family N-acetyltransferase [Thermoleptolyngbya sichuanensis XZ-Cy5]|uniref:GNAT family N-acetyltransferase n=1 Tax=Thermoleptolyngbya sichuanensis TaxID=2885951 RepID=UPI00240D3662|nr:GNAT family N-acetyltransferase [Thermoleptolyngbya sichuanensis]MDG2615939.1 GNAT family N-acetyltransferase [Thermoleptolyngbya sichuanensis XZ-Cy5]